MIEAKIERLRAILAPMGRAVVAYSGGCDSALLADVAHETLGPGALAVTAVSPSLAPHEREAAATLARERGWAHREVATHEGDRAAYRRNAPDRCYHCKSELLEVLLALPEAAGAWVLVGTNLDDLGDHRPGGRAATERGARAPLVEAGLGKDEIRRAARGRGLSVWEKPAAACLASRIAYGIEVTPERLERVGRAEDLLRRMGLREVRVRDHGDLARIEVEPGGIEALAAPGARERVAGAMRSLGFHHVTLDLEGFRSGSMNAGLLAIGRKEGRP